MGGPISLHGIDFKLMGKLTLLCLDYLLYDAKFGRRSPLPDSPRLVFPASFSRSSVVLGKERKSGKGDVLRSIMGEVRGNDDKNG